MTVHRKLCRAVAGIILVGTGVSASAQSTKVIDIDFDNKPALYNYGYTYAGEGDPFVDRGSSTSFNPSVMGGGVGGGNAVSTTADFSQLANLPPPPNYRYHGFGVGFGAQPFTFPSPNRADYTVSGQMRVAGIDGGSSVELQLQLRVPDDTFGADSNTDEDPFGELRAPLFVGTDYTPYSFNFADMTWFFPDNSPVPVEERDFAKYFDRINMNINVNVDGGPFGQDSGNSIFLDDFVIGVVPEPASILLVAPAASLLLGRRRRR